MKSLNQSVLEKKKIIYISSSDIVETESASRIANQKSMKNTDHRIRGQVFSQIPKYELSISWPCDTLWKESKRK